MKGILDSWGVDPFYLFVVMFIIQIVMIVLYVMLNTKYRRLQKSYVTFMRGKNGKNLEKSIFGKFDELDEIAELVLKENLYWEGSATELASLVKVEVQPHVITRKLNVLAGRLYAEHGIYFRSERTHEGRKLRFWKDITDKA